MDNLRAVVAKQNTVGASVETLEPIKASGGVVLRNGPDGPEVLVIHRPRYDDWSLPKGKDDPAETPEQAALREVMEETGQRVRLITPLGKTRFDTGSGIKDVDWFAMRAVPSSPDLARFTPNNEVDQARWVPISEVAEILTYEPDQSLIANIDAPSLLATGTLFLVRHGAAGDREAWEGDDRLRPLSNKGERQAKAVTALLADRDIEAIVSSPYLRCVQTVKPLAEELGLEVIENESLAEAEGGKASRELVRQLAGTNAVLCTHGDVIPELMDWMVRKGMPLRSPFDCKKGSVWEIDVKHGEFRKARYIPPLAD